MANLTSDTMTDADGTALSAHTSDTGGTYAKYPGYTENGPIRSNRARGSGVVATYAQHTHSVVPPKANYRVKVDVVAVSLVANDAAGILLRADDGVSAGNDTYYYATLTVDGGGTNGILTLNEAAAGVFTELGSYAMGALSASATYVVELEGIDTTLNVYLDGTLRISTTDSSLSAIGKAGVFVSASGDSTGLHADNFQVTYPASQPAEARTVPRRNPLLRM